MHLLGSMYIAGTYTGEMLLRDMYTVHLAKYSDTFTMHQIYKSLAIYSNNKTHYAYNHNMELSISYLIYEFTVYIAS